MHVAQHKLQMSITAGMVCPFLVWNLLEWGCHTTCMLLSLSSRPACVQAPA